MRRRHRRRRHLAATATCRHAAPESTPSAARDRRARRASPTSVQGTSPTYQQHDRTSTLRATSTVRRRRHDHGDQPRQRPQRATASRRPRGHAPRSTIVLHADAFAQIADLTDAPIPVEITWRRDPLAAGDPRAARPTGLAPRRDLGQNFVADPNTVRRIAHLAGVGPGDHVVEIGAGLGSLTLALAETGADVTAVEVDRGLAAAAARRRRRPRRTSPSSRPTRWTLDWDGVLAGGDRVGARRQPAVQRRHAARLRPARRRARRSSGCS